MFERKQKVGSDKCIQYLIFYATYEVFTVYHPSVLVVFNSVTYLLIICYFSILYGQLAGQIARASTIFRIDEVLIFGKLLIWSCVDFVERIGSAFSMWTSCLYVWTYAYNTKSLTGLRVVKKWNNLQLWVLKWVVRFFLEQVVVFDNKGSSVDGSDPTMEDESHDDESGAAFLLRILKYMETPQYLRKSLFPMHNNLRFVVRIASWNYKKNVKNSVVCLNYEN